MKNHQGRGPSVGEVTKPLMVTGWASHVWGIKGICFLMFYQPFISHNSSHFSSATIDVYILFTLFLVGKCWTHPHSVSLTLRVGDLRLELCHLTTHSQSALRAASNHNLMPSLHRPRHFSYLSVINSPLCSKTGPDWLCCYLWHPTESEVKFYSIFTDIQTCISVERYHQLI